MYRPAEIRGLLRTGGKTIEEIRTRYTGQGLTYHGFESLQRAFDLFDGQEISLFRLERNGEMVYYVSQWPKVNMKIMDAVFEAEQTHPDRRYTDNRQKFMLDWLTGKYSAGMAFAFNPEDVVELEILHEEICVTDQPQNVETTPVWRKVRNKQKRRRRGHGKPGRKVVRK